jgi:subtilisin-like proprotein convertase family protein
MRSFTKILFTGLFVLLFSTLANAQKEQTVTTTGKTEKVSPKAIKKIKPLKEKKEEKENEENDKYDGPAKAEEFQINRTKNPATGEVPAGKMWEAVKHTQQQKDFQANTPNGLNALNWVERGSNTDVVGPSNGNTRANNGKTSGRIDALLVDSADATHKTVWIGGRDGGLWKTNDITASPASWTLVNDYFGNLSIAAITQDPTNYNIMYFCTGESYFEANALRGNGVFKSTDHGVTWTQLASTTSYYYCTRILCDYQGNVYLGTRGNGLLRSTNGGTSWTEITPAGLSNNICDLEITSTAVASRLHLVTGIFSTQAYRYTDIASTVSSAAGWSAPVTAFPSYAMRAEIGVSGNTLYAAPADASYQVPTVYKSTDGGANWTATAGQPASGWASGQGWYALTVIINPANTNECFVGGLDQYKTIDGGATWTRASFWVGTTGQYVHADQHKALWYDNGNKIIFGCDGGIHFSSDGGTTITDRNQGLRLKQFYSCAIHPDAVGSPNYLLAGAQDNGTHQLNGAGLSSSVEVTGGDGAYVAIDQDQPQYQFGAYVYSNYRRSVNGGANWSSINYNNNGQFINPFEYDNTANIFYAGYSAGQFFRWSNPQTGTTAAAVTVANFNGASVTAVGVSPYTANRVYFGTNGGRVVMADNANATPTTTNLTPVGMTGYVNAVVLGASDQKLAACITSYGVSNIWVSSNGGTSWVACDGNLPDVPVYWALFNPSDNNRLYIATETGVWETSLLNGANTIWVPHNTFPTVRTTMLRYRSSDKTIVASTYGRGLWTTTLCATSSVTIPPASTTVCNNTTASFAVTAAGDGTLGYQWQVSTNAGATWSNIAGANSSAYSFTAIAGDNGNKYRCYVTNACPSSDTSAAATLTMASGTVGGTLSPAAVNACVGPNSTTMTLSGFTGNILNWESSIDGGTTWTTISNTTPSLTVTNLTQTTQYRVVVQSSGCVAATSSTATINYIAVGVGPIYVSSEFGGVMCAGTPTKLTVFNATSSTATMGNAITSLNGYIVFNFRNNNAFPVTITGINSVVSTLGINKVAAYYNTTPLTGNPGAITIANGWNQFGGAITNIPASGIQPFMTGLSLVVPAGATYGMCVAATDVAGTAGNLMYSNALAVGTATAGGCDIITNSTIGFAGGLVQNPPTTPARYFVGSFTFSGAATPLSNATVLWSPAAGLSATTTNPVAASPLTTTTYTVVATNPSGCTSTASVNLLINQSPNVTSQPVNASACSGTTAVFNITATGSGTNGIGVTYQWQESTDGGVTYTNLTNSGVYAGATTNALSVVTAIAMNNNLYRCTVNGICSPAATSAAAKLTVVASPLISVTPTTTCGGIPGKNGVKLVASSGVAAPTITLAVPSGNIAIPIIDNSPAGTLPHTLNVSGIPAGAVISEVSVTLNMTHTYVGDMSVNLKGPNGNILNLDRNLTATGNGGANFVNTVISSTGSTLLKNGTAPFTGTFKADAVNGATTPGYAFADPTGYVANATAFADLYSVPNGAWTIAMADNGAGDAGTFNNWTLTIKYSVPLAGGASLNYVWSPATGLYLDAAATIPYVAGSFKDSVYAAPVANTVYTVIGTNGVTGCVSNTATATVNYTPVAPTVNPTSVVMCLGNPATALSITSSLAPSPFSASYTSGPITVSVPDNNVAGVTSTIAVPLPAAAQITNMRVTLNMTHTWNGDMVFALKAPNGKILNLDYYLSGTGGAAATTGFTNTIISSSGTTALSAGVNPYTNTFKADAAAATASPASGPTGFTPNVTTFSGLYSTPNGNWTLAMYDGGPGDVGTITSWSLSFDYLLGIPSTGIWTPFTGLYLDAAATVPYVGTAVTTVYAKPAASTVYSVVVNTGSCNSPATIIPVTVNTPVAITSQPSSATLCTDKAISFTMTATGTTPAYQWKESTDGGVTYKNVANGGVYTGATSNTLTITAPPVSMSGNKYRCVVAGSAPCGSDSTNGLAVLTVNPLPTISITASPKKLLPGLKTTMTSTSFPAAASYNWLKNGLAVANATTGSLTIDVDGIGNYTLKVQDVNGCVNTSAVLAITDSVSGKLFIYPNPNSGQFQVRYYSALNNTGLPRGINVFDARGKRVLTKSYSITAPYARMDVNLTNLSTGIYWVEVVDGEGNRLAIGRAEVLR